VVGPLTYLGVGNSLTEGAVVGLVVVTAVRRLGLDAQDRRIGLLWAAAAAGARGHPVLRGPAAGTAGRAGPGEFESVPDVVVPGRRGEVPRPVLHGAGVDRDALPARTAQQVVAVLVAGAVAEQPFPALVPDDVGAPGVGQGRQGAVDGAQAHSAAGRGRPQVQGLGADEVPAADQGAQDGDALWGAAAEPCPVARPDAVLVGHVSSSWRRFGAGRPGAGRT
jgi:hypothetical protein